jgi:hypothetical protein
MQCTISRLPVFSHSPPVLGFDYDRGTFSFELGAASSARPETVVTRPVTYEDELSTCNATAFRRVNEWNAGLDNTLFTHHGN